MRFPEEGRTVSVFLQPIAQCFLTFKDLTGIIRVPCPIRKTPSVDVITCQNRISGRRANRGRRVGVMKGNAGLCQLVDIGCYALTLLRIEGVYITVTDIVDHED